MSSCNRKYVCCITGNLWKYLASPVKILSMLSYTYVMCNDTNWDRECMVNAFFSLIVCYCYIDAMIFLFSSKVMCKSTEVQQQSDGRAGVCDDCDWMLTGD